MSLDWLFPHLEHLGVWTYWVVFVIALAESLAIVGSIVPGASLIIFSGFLASQGYLHPVSLTWATMLGAFAGDAISYWLGTKGTSWFRNENRWLKKTHLDQGCAYFKKHGGKSVFIGRFVPLLRPIVPFVAGLSRMERSRFYSWGALSAIIWSISHITFGYFFGSAFFATNSPLARTALLVGAAVCTMGASWVITKEALRDRNRS